MSNRLAAVVIACVLAAPTFAHATRPTPHQMIDEALRAFNAQIAQLDVTDDERHNLSDVVALAESTAAELVEAQNRGATPRVQQLARRIELLARVVRGRVEAARAEANAATAEREASDADARRVQTRAALERATERTLQLDRRGAADADAHTPGAAGPVSSAPPSGGGR